MSKILHFLPRHRGKTIGVLIILVIFLHTIWNYSSVSSDIYDLDRFQDDTLNEQQQQQQQKLQSGLGSGQVIDDRPDLDKPEFDNQFL